MKHLVLFQLQLPDVRSMGPKWTKIVIPFWVPLGLFLLYPTLVFIQVRRLKRRQKMGHCKNCGYNLTGNVSGKCPECGTSIS